MRYTILTAGFVAAAFLAPLVPHSISSAFGQETTTAWWEAETALGEDGSLDLPSKSWWERAVSLETGDSFSITSELPGGGKMIVRRQELIRRGGRKTDALVWIIDDDGDLADKDTDGDTDSDCYVVDYGRDGKVDRIVDYLDNDADGTADEMDIRYFIDGVMRRSWFGLDLDDDGQMWDLKGYEYSGYFFKSDPYGNSMIFMNEYDPVRKVWVPSCECPFAFFDTDGDNQSEVVIRVSGVPLEFDPTKLEDMDYGNSVFDYSGPFTQRMRHPGAVNFRYSFDIDGLSSDERPLHYEMGYNLIGHVPYEFKGMARKNQLRRAPKVTNCIPYKDLRHVADTYPAEATGFTWREYGDDGVSLGGPPLADEDRRWEGVFWTWSRRFMHNTGGPIQNWNMRREFRPSPGNKRELYWCRADRRIHLKGATDGWIRVGHLANTEPWGEIRFFDTDRDGYFDRWETHLTGQTMPVRVSTARDAGIRDLPSDYDELREIYTQELLPEALDANDTLMGAMRKMGDYQVPDHLQAALSAATCDTERLYVKDLIREGLYLDLRRRLAKQSEELFAGFPPADLRRKPKELATSIKAWKFSRLMSDLDAAYGEGRYDDAAKCLEKLATP
jgi:hypothetical protein